MTRNTRARSTLDFDMRLSDGSGLKGRYRCTDDQWQRIFAVLLEKPVPPDPAPYCANDGTCSCAKFGDDPTKCERQP